MLLKLFSGSLILESNSLGLEVHDHLLGVVELLVLLVHGLALLVHLVEEEEPGEPGDGQAEHQGAVRALRKEKDD